MPTRGRRTLPATLNSNNAQAVAADPTIQPRSSTGGTAQHPTTPLATSYSGATAKTAPKAN
eukprot:11938967-Prorocentrum_lima.AAC.1